MEMTDHETRFEAGQRYDWVNGEVVRCTPAVSLGFYMLSQAGTLSRDQLAASNTAQLTAIGGMVQLIRQCARELG